MEKLPVEVLRLVFEGTPASLWPWDKNIRDDWNSWQLVSRKWHSVVSDITIDLHSVEVLAKNGTEEAVLRQLKKLLNTSLRSPMLTKVFLASVSRCHQKVVSLLLENGADVNMKDRHGRRPLHLTAGSGKDRYECNPWPAGNSHVALSQLLIDKGADVNALDNERKTPLHSVVKYGPWGRSDGKDNNGHLKSEAVRELIVQVLLDNGADMNMVDQLGRSPLTLATWGGSQAVVRLLLEKGADQNIDLIRPLQVAAADGQEAVVRMILEKGADQDIDLSRPLQMAATFGREAVVRMLLEREANFDGKCHGHGKPPLLYATANGHEAVVRLLLEKGADVNATDRYGRTSLFKVASCRYTGFEHDHEAILQHLLDHGADINARWAGGRTALWRLVMRSRRERMIRFFVGKGADFNLQDDRGQTVLDFAAAEYDNKYVKLLIELGAKAGKS